MVLHIILADILLIARIFPRPFGARKNTTQLAKYPRVLYVKSSNKIYVFASSKGLVVNTAILEKDPLSHKTDDGLILQPIKLCW